MKIVFIGVVSFSKSMLEKLIDLEADIVGVVTKSDSKFNADFCDLSSIAEAYNIPWTYTRDINSGETMTWIKSKSPDIVFCFGFSQLIKKNVLSIAPMGILGSHPAALPQNRGRHPIIWPLVLGLEKTASTFFFMDEGADSGDILSQREVEIEYEDDASSLYGKIVKTAKEQLEDFLPKLENKTYEKAPQNQEQANYWRKRIRKDGEIDFRMSSRAIYNLVRGLAKPYIGAYLVYQEEEIKVWKVREEGSDLKNCEYGKILDIHDQQILVKSQDQAVWLVDHEFKQLPNTGDYLL